MASEQQPLDITDMPELSRLADEVCQTGRPRVLRRAGEDVAVLVPLKPAARMRPADNPALAALLARLPKDSVVARTAGALWSEIPFPGYDEEQAATERAVADDAVARVGG